MKKIMLLFALFCMNEIGFSNEKDHYVLMQDYTIQISKINKNNRDSIFLNQDTTRVKSLDVRPIENIETINVCDSTIRVVEIVTKNQEKAIKNILQERNSKARITPKQKAIPIQSRWSKKSN